jgi:hypothetical protein
VDEHLARVEAGTLAQVIATRRNGEGAASHRLARWLFAVDPAGMASFRTLAPLSARPEQAARAWQEVEASRNGGRGNLRFLRVCMLESLRLWPTTPTILRESKAETQWHNGRMPRIPAS